MQKKVTGFYWRRVLGSAAWCDGTGASSGVLDARMRKGEQLSSLSSQFLAAGGGGVFKQYKYLFATAVHISVNK